jgi:hypothetical protein
LRPACLFGVVCCIACRTASVNAQTVIKPPKNTGLGDPLVAIAPQELKQPVYHYSFTPVNLKEINAFRVASVDV